MTDLSDVASAVLIAPNLIQVEIFDSQGYDQKAQKLELGSYLKIEDDRGSAVLAVVQSYRIKEDVQTGPGSTPSPRFIVDAQPVGRLRDERFTRGGKQISI